MPRGGSPPTCTLLLSGGVDSTTLGSLLLSRRWRVSALFVDHGQRAARWERQASRRVADHYGLPWVEKRVTSHGSLPLTEVPGRNDLLIAVGFTLQPDSVAIGTHGGTPYADCSPAHIMAWQTLLDVQHHGRKRLVAPFASMSKDEVVAVARREGVPLALTRSCDDSGDPCHRCASCLDRERLLAGT